MGELWFVDEDGNRGTVSVSREVVESLLHAGGSPHVALHVAVQGVRAALPWEPSDEMIGAIRSVWSGLGPDRATDLLKDQHEAGVFAAYVKQEGLTNG